MNKLLIWLSQRINEHVLIVLFFTFCYGVIQAGSYYWSVQVIDAAHDASMIRKMGYAREGIDSTLSHEDTLAAIEAVTSGNLTPNLAVKQKLDTVSRILGTGVSYLVKINGGKEAIVVADSYRLHILSQGYPIGTVLTDPKIIGCFIKVRYYVTTPRVDSRGSWWTTCWPVYDHTSTTVIGAIVVDFSVAEEKRSHPELGKILLYSFANTYLPILLSVMLVTETAFRKVKNKR